MSVPEPRAPRAAPPARFSPWAALAVFFGALICSIVIGSIALAVSGESADDPGWATTLGYVGGQIGGTIGGCALVSRVRGTGSMRTDFGLRVRLDDWAWLFAGILTFFVASVLVLPLVLLVEQGQPVVEDLESAGGAELAVIAVTAALLAPISEELLFRGLLLRSLLIRVSPAWAIGISAVAFAAVHPLLDGSLGTLARTPAFVLLGVVSGYEAWRTGALSRSILLHVGFNLVTVVGVLFS
jgi:membrane protease YdiL (CAAX protease family)